MRMLERSFKVTTRYGGGFVESIDGHAGSSARRDWFYYVNGIQATQGAAGTVGPQGRPDLVGPARLEPPPTRSRRSSAPSPSRSSTASADGGSRPRSTAPPDAGAACKPVAAAARRDRGPGREPGARRPARARTRSAWSSAPGTTSTADRSPQLIAHGPASSGVYARFVGPSGPALELLDPRGQVVRTLGAGAGLIAATAQTSTRQPTWLITGTDAGRACRPPPRRSRRRGCTTTSRSRSRARADLPVPLERVDVIYRRRASPLHAARAAVGCAYCAGARARRAAAVQPGRARRGRARRSLGAGGLRRASGASCAAPRCSRSPLGLLGRWSSTRWSPATG